MALLPESEDLRLLRAPSLSSIYTSNTHYLLSKEHYSLSQHILSHQYRHILPIWLVVD